MRSGPPLPWTSARGTSPLALDVEASGSGPPYLDRILSSRSALRRSIAAVERLPRFLGLDPKGGIAERGERLKSPRQTQAPLPCAGAQINGE